MTEQACGRCSISILADFLVELCDECELEVDELEECGELCQVEGCLQSWCDCGHDQPTGDEDMIHPKDDHWSRPEMPTY